MSNISVLEDKATGQAFISIDDTGEISIIVIPGANGALSRQMMEKERENLRETVKNSAILVMQLEIPFETVMYLKKLAVSFHKLVIVDPAPAAASLPDSFWNGIDYLKPNETALSILTGRQMNTREEIARGAVILLEKGVRNVIVTMGSKGYLFDTERFFQAPHVKAVDTTAAGDCFTAAFALALAEGKTCPEAIAFGQAACAIAVTRKGAQPSIPSKEEVPSPSM